MSKSLMFGLLWTAVLAFSPVGADEGEDHNESPLAPVPFETIEEGQFSGIVSQRFEVVRDEESFAQLWLDHTAPASPPPEAPVIDFEQDMVIAVFLGTQPTGGFSVEVVDVSPTNGVVEDINSEDEAADSVNNVEEDVNDVEEGTSQLVVHVRATFPGPNCVVTQALTQPYQLVLLRRVPDIVAFQTTVEQQDCPASEEQDFEENVSLDSDY
jgi:hypothetical protein